MNKLLIFTLLLFFAVARPANSQVTIGSDKQPVEGSLLMLDDGTSGANNQNAKKGLLLPRVDLQNYNQLKMGDNAPDLTTEATAHVGLMVYNINTEFDRCDPQSMPSGVFMWNGEKWNPLLAVDQHYQAPSEPDLTAPLNQPNTYMLEAGRPNSVTFPISKAFAVWEYWSSSRGGSLIQPRTFEGQLSVDIVWQEGYGDTSDDPILLSMPTLSSNDIADRNTATMTVNTTGKPGNAVVSVKDGNDVLWSWHIWVTPKPAEINYNGKIWMDRNLGAITAEIATDGVTGLHYQFGRHTPFPAIRKFNGVFDNNNLTNVALDFASIDDILANSSSNTLAFAIKNPKTFITVNAPPHDWFSKQVHQWTTRWSENVKVLDECGNESYEALNLANPCPAGWKMPSAYHDVNTSNKYYSDWGNLSNDNKIDHYENQGRYWPDAGYYPGASSRLSNGILSNLGVQYFQGLYFTSTGNVDTTLSNSNGLALVFTPSTLSTTSSLTLGAANSVRCIKAE